MKIVDELNNIIENPDLSKGYLIDDQLFVKHHDEVLPVEEQFHYETICVYPNGGKDVERVIDVEAVEAKEPWDEYEDVQRYKLYTSKELEEIEKIKNTPSQLDKIEAQITYSAISTNTLIALQQPASIPSLVEEQPRSPKQELLDNIKKWIKQGLWTESMANEMVEKDLFTQEEVTKLIGSLNEKEI